MNESTPMTKAQIAMVFRKAPAYSQFHLQVGQLVKEKWDSDKMIWIVSKPMRYMTREAAKRLAEEQAVFSLTYVVMRPHRRPAELPAAFANYTD